MATPPPPLYFLLLLLHDLLLVDIVSGYNFDLTYSIRVYAVNKFCPAIFNNIKVPGACRPR